MCVCVCWYYCRVLIPLLMTRSRCNVGAITFSHITVLSMNPLSLRMLFISNPEFLREKYSSPLSAVCDIRLANSLLFILTNHWILAFISEFVLSGFFLNLVHFDDSPPFRLHFQPQCFKKKSTLNKCSSGYFSTLN